MSIHQSSIRTFKLATIGIACLFLISVGGLAARRVFQPWRRAVRPIKSAGQTGSAETSPRALSTPADAEPPRFQPRIDLDITGYSSYLSAVPRWTGDSSLAAIGELWKKPGLRKIPEVDAELKAARDRNDDIATIRASIHKARLYAAEGEPRRSAEVLDDVRRLVESRDGLARQWLYTVVYLQGVIALRCGETENCVDCRGESACILPLAPSAVHRLTDGSRRAVRHFTEYLVRFPDDLEVRWLLNLAHMTLGEYPDRVDPRFLIALDHFRRSEFDIGVFRDISDRVGVDRVNLSGGAIMEDFDNDGWLDLAVTCWGPTVPMAIYRNTGAGRFEDRSQSANVTDQLGGLYCVQTDYDNDGLKDIFIVRGAWLSSPIRPSLLRNRGDGTFVDVTGLAGLARPCCSNSAAWADYDNDGWLDVFVCCEHQSNRLYRNRGNGTFAEVTADAGLIDPMPRLCKGVAWLDFDNDDDPDLFLNNLASSAQLYRNEGNGRFTDVTAAMGVRGPSHGFSCWAWDYDNDGWLDIFATCYDRTLSDVINGLIGRPHSRGSNALLLNRQGQGFKDKTREAGLDLVFASMGSNHGDFDNDGFLDMYLGTGDPSYATLIPNRMFRNVAGERFAEITGSARTGHLQKGHGVACGDWDRDGDIDLFVELGGAVAGDRYHNVLFENPGQGHHWLTVKLVGQKTNRAAIGARIKMVTAGDRPLTVYRHVSSGSSFGANPLEQTIGLAEGRKVALLEIHWPTSGTTQQFRDINADQAIEITEFANSWRPYGPRPAPPGGHNGRIAANSRAQLPESARPGPKRAAVSRP